MSVGSAAALVAGTTVGAGVLALPAATRGAGFVASSGVLVASWAFMAVAALLVAETSVGVVCATGRVDLGFLATVRSLCGPRVGSVAGAAYAFIHYALLVAYAAQGGALLAGAVGADPALGAVAFSGVLGGTVAFGSGDVVDAVNNAFVVVVVASFSALLCLGSGEFDAGRLFATSGDAGAAFGAVPISILALVYHNVVPLVATRLKGDRRKIAAAILCVEIKSSTRLQCERNRTV
jgi:tyrosine-specific transport protein